MPIKITIPRLGWSMDEGTFGEWVKQNGDYVSAGDPIFLLESEKALQEVESIDEGILHILPGAPKGGDTVKVGAVIGYLLAEGEEVPEVAEVQALNPTETAQTDRPVPNISPPTANARVTSSKKPPLSAAPPSVRRLARELGIDLASLDLTTTISQNDVLRAASDRTSSAEPQNLHSPLQAAGFQLRNSHSSLPTISPRAARAARRFNVDWTRLFGSGRGGRIREQDVLAVSGNPQIPDGILVPATPARKLIAERLAQSVRTTVPVTLTTVANIDAVLQDRADWKQRALPGERVASIHDYMMASVAKVLEDFPAMNSRWINGEILQPGGIHIGLAIDTENGLIVPVVRDANLQSLPELAKATAMFVSQARERKLTSRQCSGGTFTISNLGSFGIDAFTPIINLGESSILGIGAIRAAVMPGENGEVKWSKQITLSLTFDHQVVDGAPAARFLQCLCEHIGTQASERFR